MRILLHFALLALGALPTMAQTPPSMTVGQSQMATVGPEVRLIEEEGLVLDASLQAANRPLSSQVSSSDPSRLNEAARTARARAAYSEDANPKDNGLRLYRFTLAPRETLVTRVHSDGADVVTQRFGLLSGPSFTPSAASKSQIARLNRLNRQQRSSRIDFTNAEDRPFPLLLIVYGQVGHPYKIEISRETAK